MRNFARVTLTSISLVCLASPATAKTLIDYFQPIPIVGTLTTSGWGIGTSGPRDPDNGIEDIPNWRYWDGKIIKASDGKYHLFCSKWPVSKGLAAWMSDSVSVHAVSDSNILGPYKEQGLTYTYQNGEGHNTTGLILLDGTYAVVESAIVPGWIFTSSSLNGPFTYQGSISWDGNGFNPSNITSNLGGTPGTSTSAGNGSSGCSCDIRGNRRPSVGGFLFLFGLAILRRARSMAANSAPDAKALEGFRPSRDGLWRAKLAFAHTPHAVVGQEGEALLGERRAEDVAKQALARGLVLGAGDARRVQIEPELLHDERAHGVGPAPSMPASCTAGRQRSSGPAGRSQPPRPVNPTPAPRSLPTLPTARMAARKPVASAV